MLKYVAKRFLRAELSQFLPTARLVAQFEKLSQDVVETIPANIEQTVQAALLANVSTVGARVDEAESRIEALERAPVNVDQESLADRVQALELLPRVVVIESATAVSSTAAMTPTFVPAGQTFAVPADTQVLMAEEIDLEGDLDLDGVLVEVN